MAAERAGRDIEFVIADFPTWQVDPGLMQQVFVNLISNAIKFTRERAKARIEIGYRMDGTTLVCFVKDNGVGFNMKYMNKLFGVFQRLHSADQFEGTGVGLVDRAPDCRTPRRQGLGRRRAGPGRDVLLQPAGQPLPDAPLTARRAQCPRKNARHGQSPRSLPDTDERVARNTSAIVNNRIQGRTLHDVSRFIDADPVFIDERIQQLESRMGHRAHARANAASVTLIGLVLGIDGRPALPGPAHRRGRLPAATRPARLVSAAAFVAAARASAPRVRSRTRSWLCASCAETSSNV